MAASEKGKPEPLQEGKIRPPAPPKPEDGRIPPPVPKKPDPPSQTPSEKK